MSGKDIVYTSDGRIKGKRLRNAEPWICRVKVAGIDDGRTECGCENLFGRTTCSICGAPREASQ